jgi:hypothetical protein
MGPHAADNTSLYAVGSFSTDSGESTCSDLSKESTMSARNSLLDLDTLMAGATCAGKMILGRASTHPAGKKLLDLASVNPTGKKLLALAGLDDDKDIEVSTQQRGRIPDREEVSVACTLVSQMMELPPRFVDGEFVGGRFPRESLLSSGLPHGSEAGSEEVEEEEEDDGDDDADFYSYKSKAVELDAMMDRQVRPRCPPETTDSAI